MAIATSTNYGKILVANLENNLVTREGIFNAAYQGSIQAGAVKIPTLGASTISNYSTTNLAANGVSYGTAKYITATIDRDIAVNEYLDGYEGEAVSFDLVAGSLERAAYGLADAIDADGIATLVKGCQGKDRAGNAYGSTDPRYQLAGTSNISYTDGTDDAYTKLLKLGECLTTAKVPMAGRYAIVNANFYAGIMNSNKAIRQSDLSQDLVTKGVMAQCAGFNVYVSQNLGQITVSNANKDVAALAGHPLFAAAPIGFIKEPIVVDGNSDASVVGGSFVKGRVAFTHEVLDPRAFALAYKA